MEVGLTERLDSFVRAHSDRQLAAIPLAVFLVAIIILGIMFASSGAPVRLGMEFEGGTLISVSSQDPAVSFEQKYADYPITDARETGSRVIMQFGPMSNEQQSELVRDVTSTYSSVEIKQIGPLYGASLQQQAIQAVILSFIGMAIMVFLLFKTFIPSIAVVLSALSDILIAAAFMNVAGIELSLGTVAALLMIIGYSVDSDILLTTRVLKRRGTPQENISNAMHTGITMTTTTLAALVVMYLVSTYSYLLSPSLTQITLLSDISIVLIFGLLADLMNTWLLNTSILRWYAAGRNPRGRKA
ncbi:protein translocase subunit SecF [Methanolobus halotolerans]|uniref:Protein-export membrane protein SecF n=1 Tax=Methanolobus halotolerans TaxID=2052935 RepID=A0A4E0PZ79_9EURY|nr:protein translocase subunit SecF [Methanolobus halotolerans]TGC10972.1 preprotein translocase subunit SecF [Methanolobus halotolerans]